MKAIVLVGHGSLVSDSGKAMIRLAKQINQHGAAPIVEAGFLNYSQPTLRDAVAAAVLQGASAVTVQPYFLIEGKYVREDLRAEIAALVDHFPGIEFVVGEVFGQHRLLTDIVMDRIRVVDPALGQEGRPVGILMMAHGTPYPEANAPIERIAARVHARADFCRVQVGYLDCNTPTIPEAIDQFVADGTNRIIAVPYFLHAGRHTQKDLPTLLAEAKDRHPHVEIRQTAAVGGDARLAEIIVERLAIGRLGD